MGDLLFLIILFLLSILFAVTEEAISLSNSIRVKRRADEGNKRAQKLYDMLKKDPDVNAVLRIGSILIIMAFIAYAVIWSNVYFGLSAAFNEWYSFLIYFVIILLFSYALIVLINIISLVVARKDPEKTAYTLIGFVLVAKVLIKPLVKPFLPPSDESGVRRIDQSTEQKEQEDFEEEVQDILETSAEQGKMTEENVEMISNVFEFGDETIGDIVTHRKDIAALNINAEIPEMIELLIDQKYSRIPVYEENIDNIIGILHVKDLLKYLLLGKSLEELNLRDILNKPIFLPVSKKANELFKEMQISKTHMAIVIDEYGGTAGIVTMEDLIEEIMGSILDEYDDEEAPEIEKIDEKTYRISGTTDLEEVAEYFDIPFPTDDYETLGGFLISRLGHIPSEDERPEIEYENHLFICEKIGDRRIDSVLVCIRDEQRADEAGEV